MGVSEADYIEMLDLIQEAALEPAAWERVLRQLAKQTNCIAGGLTIENPRTGEGMPLVYFGFDKNHVEKTFAYYLPMNPLFKIAPLMQPGFIVTNGDVIPTDVFRRTEFYDGWARPQRLCSPLTLVLYRGQSVYCPLTLVRPDGTGEATDDDRALLKRLAPHLIRAMRVTMQLDQLRNNRFAMEQSLARIATAVLLLDRQKHVVFANPAAERLLASGTALATVRGTLAARGSPSDHELQKAILAAIRQEPGTGAEIRVEREQGRPLLLTVIPVATDSLFASLLEDAVCCAVFVNDPDSVQASRRNAVARAYDLTPAEAEVAIRVLEGHGLKSVADALHVTLSTVRIHLQRVFEKTGTHRQAELVRLLMELEASHVAVMQDRGAEKPEIDRAARWRRAPW